MKKTLLALLAVLMVAIMAVALVACGETNGPAVNPDDPTRDVGLYKTKGSYETINDPLSWEAINKFPVVHDGMTIQEGRDLVVDFFRYCKTAVWIPSEDYEYTIKSDGEAQHITGGVKYGGLPYTSVSSGNIYRLLDYIDPATGVGDIKTMGAKKTLFGNQCSFGSYVGIGRVINSADYSWTKNMTLSAGFLKVGDYIYDETTTEYKGSENGEGGYNTITILKENGVVFSSDYKKADPDSLEKMNKCYAQLKKGDVIVYFTTAGHVVMISEDAHIEYKADGVTIDPEKSYVKVIDQTPSHGTTTNAAGDEFAYEKNVDAIWSFQKLANGKYVPFTFGEWTGADKIESSKTEINYKEDSITLEKLSDVKITSNYGITDAYVSVYNANGVEVYKLAVRSTTTSVKEVKLALMGGNVDIWGNADNLKPAEYQYTVKIYAQLSTGERPTLWEGKLAQ